MYKGTIKQESKFKIVYPTKFQMLTIEQYENNGVVMEQLKMKTREFKADPKINVRDFDIKNLMATNALGQLQECKLSKSVDMIEKEATKANNVIEQIELIKEFENEKPTQTQNEVA